MVDNCQRGRNCCQPQLSCETLPERVHLLAHGAGVADDAPCPVEHAFAFRREALETGPAINQEYPEGIL